MRRRALFGWFGASTAAVVAGCFKPDQEAAQLPQPALGEPVQFTFGTIEGVELSSDTTRGRTTALLFVTTYDLPSQAEAQLLRDVVAAHKPRANAAIVIMEAPRTAPLARVWAEAIGLSLPIAMASPALIAGDSGLGRVNGVPTLIVLDRRGRLVLRNEGGLKRDELAACLDQADKSE